MTLTKGSLAAVVGASITIILFFVGPWFERNVGFLNFGADNGLALAGQGTPSLYVVPIAAVVAPVVIYLGANGTLTTQVTSLALLALGILPAGCLLFALPTIAHSQSFLFVQLGQIGWGAWGTLVGLILISLGGLLNLLGIE